MARAPSMVSRDRRRTGKRRLAHHRRLAAEHPMVAVDALDAHAGLVAGDAGGLAHREPLNKRTERRVLRPPAQELLLRPRSRSQSADVGPRRGAAAESRSRHIRRSDRRARRLRSRSHKVHSASGCGPRSHRDCQRAPACGLRAGLALSRRSLRSVDGGFEDVRDVSSGRGKRRANRIGSCLESRSSSSQLI